jgi:hypothetical protein
VGSGDIDTCATATLAVVEDPCLNPIAPGQPTNLEVANLDLCNKQGNTVRLTWDPPADLDGGPVSYYNIYRCTEAGCTPSLDTDRIAGGIAATSQEPFDTLSYDDVITGEKIDKTGVFRYAVTAMNAICTELYGSQPESSIGEALVVEDPCE